MKYIRKITFLISFLFFDCYSRVRVKNYICVLAAFIAEKKEKYILFLFCFFLLRFLLFLSFLHVRRTWRGDVARGGEWRQLERTEVRATVQRGS